MKGLTILNHSLHMIEIVLSEPDVGRRDENITVIGQLSLDRLRLNHHIRTRTSGGINERIFYPAHPEGRSTSRA